AHGTVGLVCRRHRVPAGRHAGGARPGAPCDIHRPTEYLEGRLTNGAGVGYTVPVRLVGPQRFVTTIGGTAGARARLTAMRASRLALVMALALTAGLSAQQPSSPYTVDVDYHTLDNGLKVVLSRDTTAPVAVVAVYYNIGFRIEPRDRSGFAHLFEHMMFQGRSEEHTSELQSRENLVCRLL